LLIECIYSHLMEGDILKAFISRYFSSSSTLFPLGELNLTWTIGTTADGSNAETLPIGVPRNGVYDAVEIRLSEEYLNTSSSILIAQTMLHEALHAKLIAEVYDEKQTTDFFVLYAYYRKFPTGSLDEEQELQMLNDYTDELALALQQYDQSQGVNNTVDFYSEALNYYFSSLLKLPIYYDGENEYGELLNSAKNCN